MLRDGNLSALGRLQVLEVQESALEMCAGARCAARLWQGRC